MKTIKREKLNVISMGSGGKGKPTKVILDGNVHQYVGIGWVDEGKASAADLDKYPTVVD